MAEANLRWRAQTSEAEAQIVALKAVIDSIHSTSTRQGLKNVSRDLETVGKDGEKAFVKLRRGVDAVASGLAKMVTTVGTGLVAALGIASTTINALFLPSLIAVGVALASIAALAAPILAAMAAITALGALGNVFKMGKDGPKLIGEWKKLGHDIFDTIHKIAQVVSKPLFAFLLYELKQLDKWVHTEEFKKGMEAIGKMLPKVAHSLISNGKAIVNWYIDNWPTIKHVLIQSVHAFNDVVSAIKWVVKEVKKYWPQFKNAILTAWADIQPVLAALKNLFHSLQPAIQWLGDKAPAAISAFATAVKVEMAVLAGIINAIATSINAVVSSIKYAQNLAGFGGSGSGPVNLSAGRGAGAHAPGGHVAMAHVQRQLARRSARR